MLEEQPLEVNVSTELPGFVAPGAVLDVTTVSGTATVDEQTRQALRYIGATTLEGRVAANAHVAGPNLDLDVTLPLTITPRAIPREAGAFQVKAAGELPSLVFNERHSGEVVITVNDIVTTLMPRDHNDKATGMGRFESECAVRPGQDRVLHRLVVGEGEGTPGPVMDFYGATRLGGKHTPLPLSGELAPDEASTDGRFSAELSFVPARGTFPLTAFAGLMALEVEVLFEVDGPASLSVSEQRLKLDMSTPIHVPVARLKLFGLTLARGGGTDCRGIAPAQWTLRTPEGETFDPQAGGRLTGLQQFPEVEHCGGLAGLISGTLAGPDNPVDLELTPVDTTP